MGSIFKRRSSLQFHQRKKLNMALIRNIASWITEIAAVILFSYLVVNFFCVRTTVIGTAMEPVLYNEDTVLVNEFSYIVSHPHQGDIVVFLPNGSEKSHYYIRRIVAEPGDTVRIADGLLYVNDAVYELDEETEKITDPGLAAEGITLGEGEYFVLGDNRNNSEDSRYVTVGNVSEDYMIGKVWFRYSSLKDWGTVK